MRTMYDSSNALDCPNGGDLYLAYTDGRYAQVEQTRALHPDAVIVECSAIGTNTGKVGDVENGCIWPPENAPAWAQKRRDSGEADPAIYCSVSLIRRIVNAFDDQGIARPTFGTAHYTGREHICSRVCGDIPDGIHVVFTQWANATYTGGHYDQSVVIDGWPDNTAERPSGGGSLIPDNATPSPEEDDMARLGDIAKIEQAGAGVRDQACYYLGMSGWAYINGETLELLRAKGEVKENQPIIWNAREADLWFALDGLLSDIGGQ